MRHCRSIGRGCTLQAQLVIWVCLSLYYTPSACIAHTLYRVRQWEDHKCVVQADGVQYKMRQGCTLQAQLVIWVCLSLYYTPSACIAHTLYRERQWEDHKCVVQADGVQYKMRHCRSIGRGCTLQAQLVIWVCLSLYYTPSACIAHTLHRVRQWEDHKCVVQADGVQYKMRHCRSIGRRCTLQAQLVIWVCLSLCYTPSACIAHTLYRVRQWEDHKCAVQADGVQYKMRHCRSTGRGCTLQARLVIWVCLSLYYTPSACIAHTLYRVRQWEDHKRWNWERFYVQVLICTIGSLNDDFDSQLYRCYMFVWDYRTCDWVPMWINMLITMNKRLYETAAKV